MSLGPGRIPGTQKAFDEDWLTNTLLLKSLYFWVQIWVW